MDFLKAVNIIGRDLEEALALLEQLSGVSGSDLAEIELARSRVRSAADLVKLLPALTGEHEKKKPGNTQILTGPKAAEAAARIPHFAETVTHESPVAETLPSAAPVAETMPPASPVAELEMEESPVTEPAAILSQPATPGQKSQEPSRAILADRFVPGGTLGEKITNGKKDEVFSSVIQSKPITDIAAAIGINDRFYFIRELFSGDSRAYSDTIGRLNAAASLGEAMKILDESTVMGSDPAAQSSFVDVVRRKFSVNV
ncbi:MAG: hypothetical protein MUE37_07155 [Bacteroidales bacterium]|nr:hypothetical protein [Bacteroidales bacterium]